ncbi:MAG: SDR family oxidoreductase [Bacillota bacterium]
MNEPILVTGAPGNVGTSVVESLVKKGYQVRVAAWDLSLAHTAFGGSAEYVRFDFEDPGTYAAALDGVKRLFLVRPPHLPDVERQINPFVEAARAAGVKHVVLLSVMGAEHVSILPHARIEKAILASGMAYTFLRPAFFFQNLSTTFRRMIAETGEIALPLGRSRMSWIDSRDIGAAAAIALTRAEHRNRAYTLAEQAYSVAQLAEAFTSGLGRPIRYPRPSFWAYRRQMRRYGLPEGLVNLTTMMFLIARLGLSAAVPDDLHLILGRRPLGPAEFVRDHAHLWG